MNDKYGTLTDRENILLYSLYMIIFTFLSIYCFLNGLWILGIVEIPFALLCGFVDFVFISMAILTRYTR